VGGGQEIQGLYSVLGGRPKDEGGGGQSEPAPTRVALRMEDGTWTGNTILVSSCQLANKGA